MREMYSSRREFLKTATLAAGAAAWPLGAARASFELNEGRRALFFDTLDDGRARCGLCPHGCVLADQQRGNCQVRENRGGKLVTLSYGYPVAVHNDPIEKKPFMHVYPGSKALSISTVGCNFHCRFCQNWEISQSAGDRFKTRYVPPDEIAQTAVREGSRTVAYTYGEPVVFYEYMRDVASAARALDVGNVMISNGFIEERPLKELLPLMTAVKVDLKSFREEFYRNICGGALEPVKRTLRTVAGEGVWLEIVVLLIPTLNDSSEEITEMSRWIVGELGPDTPVHFIRFHPQYKLKNLPSTPDSTFDRAKELAAKAGLNFVYASAGHASTRCPKCGAVLVERFRDVVLSDAMTGPECPSCGARIPGIWK